MVVREELSQYMRANTQSLASVSVARQAPIGESPEDLDAIRERIRRGQALLKVVEYPWGVEFDVVNVEGRR
ncbi:MAG TPA: hypothetical protein VED22_04875 [Nitrososphaerales archaeon]|nr:hypothetical protein [Nitrososphaerales archaeon]